MQCFKPYNQPELPSSLKQREFHVSVGIPVETDFGSHQFHWNPI
ncbi:unnamed protein product [Anisakis simplex]|uniref:Uncharacterized protein n=1 Tax=Anisakis simplex TaxID=6269 RepID=A0A3P6PBX4_ANISI|nr:unnamed protein product [Anisakis simplex]